MYILACVVGGLILIPVIWTIVVYNRLARGRIRAQNGFSQIDVQLKRRCALVPNLVEAVRGYMAHERQTLESVIAARNAAVASLTALSSAPGDVATMRALAGASGALDQLLMRLSVTIERYPELKASTNVLGLQEELVSTENRIAFARQAYNDAVMSFNTSVAVFPQTLIAAAFSFVPLALFAAADGDRAAPTVKF